jgi:hypothetical protein
VWLFYQGEQVRRFDWSNIFLSVNYLKTYTGKMQAWLAYHERPASTEVLPTSGAANT